MGSYLLKMFCLFAKRLLQSGLPRCGHVLSPCAAYETEFTCNFSDWRRLLEKRHNAFQQRRTGPEDLICLDFSTWTIEMHQDMSSDLLQLKHPLPTSPCPKLQNQGSVHPEKSELRPKFTAHRVSLSNYIQLYFLIYTKDLWKTFGWEWLLFSLFDGFRNKFSLFI